MTRCVRTVQGGPQNVQTCFCPKFVKPPPNLITVGTLIVKTAELCKKNTYCPPHIIYVTSLLCKTQMLQIVA